LIVSLSGLVLSVGLAAGACDPAVESSLRQLLDDVGSAAFECPANVDGDLCAVLDDQEAFQQAWDNKVGAEVEAEVYELDGFRLTLRFRGGVAAIGCMQTAAAPETEKVELRDLLRRALAYAGAAVFECPPVMLDPDGKEDAVCAFYEGSIHDFELSWTLPEERARPLSDWRRGVRDYEIDGRKVQVRVNNGVAAATYALEPDS